MRTTPAAVRRTSLPPSVHVARAPPSAAVLVVEVQAAAARRADASGGLLPCGDCFAWSRSSPWSAFSNLRGTHRLLRDRATRWQAVERGVRRGVHAIGTR